jgi:hypothetical protein
MKRFIIQLAVFLLILFWGISIYLVLVFRFNSKTIENYKFEKGINKLIAGDSHTKYCIDDKLLTNTQNISQDSEGMLYSYFKLKTLLINNPQIDTVLLGASYHSFSSYYNKIYSIPEVTGRYFFILTPILQVKLLMDTKNTFPAIQKSIINGTKNWIQNSPDYSFLGGFDTFSSSIPLNDSLIERRINNQYFDEGKLNTFFEENIYYFEKIVQMCKDMNVKLIVLNTPMHKRYKEKVPTKFVNEFNTLVTNGGSIEADDLKLSDTDFPDGDMQGKRCKACIVVPE